MTDLEHIKEGALFKRIELHGRVFHIYYGYYADFERESEFNEPIPIYPDFRQSPVYTDDGRPFVTRMQDQCKNGRRKHSQEGEAFCIDCPYFIHGDELIGICGHADNQLNDNSHIGGC